MADWNQRLILECLAIPKQQCHPCFCFDAHADDSILTDEPRGRPMIEARRGLGQTAPNLRDQSLADVTLLLGLRLQICRHLTSVLTAVPERPGELHATPIGHEYDSSDDPRHLPESQFSLSDCVLSFSAAPNTRLSPA